MKKLISRWEKCKSCQHSEPRKTKVLGFVYPDHTDQLDWYDPFCTLAGAFLCYGGRDPCPLDTGATLTFQKGTQLTLGVNYD